MIAYKRGVLLKVLELKDYQIYFNDDVDVDRIDSFFTFLRLYGFNVHFIFDYIRELVNVSGSDLLLIVDVEKDTYRFSLNFVIDKDRYFKWVELHNIFDSVWVIHDVDRFVEELDDIQRMIDDIMIM